MAHDVFISHATKDKAVADAARAALEAHGIRCWVASRDILPSAEWGESIVTAIAEAKVFLLIFSQHANASPYILREVERAVSHNTPLIPLRIEDIAPDASLGYFLGAQQWLDAYSPPFEQHLEHLVKVVRLLIDRPGSGQPPPQPSPGPQPGAPFPAPAAARRTPGRWPILAGVAGLVAAAAAAVVLLRPLHPAAAAVDPKCLVMVSSLADPASCRALLDQGPAWEGCAASFADTDMRPRVGRARSLIARGRTGSDLYETAPAFKEYAAISHYWEMLGLCVAQNDVDFGALSGSTSFPTHYWQATRPLRSEIGGNWSGPGQPLPDFLSNLQALCQRYKAAREKLRPGGGQTLDCSS